MLALGLSPSLCNPSPMDVVLSVINLVEAILFVLFTGKIVVFGHSLQALLLLEMQGVWGLTNLKLFQKTHLTLTGYRFQEGIVLFKYLRFRSVISLRANGDKHVPSLKTFVTCSGRLSPCVGSYPSRHLERPVKILIAC